jgi:hypothetical protein
MLVNIYIYIYIYMILLRGVVHADLILIGTAGNWSKSHRLREIDQSLIETAGNWSKSHRD